jgi:drug/metabolite transporter (DMT)-like permease
VTITVFAMVVGAALLHAVWNTLVKGNGDRLTMMAIMMAGQAVIAVSVLPFVAFPATASWPYIWASVVLHNGYYLFLIMAYRYGDLSHVYPIARGISPLIVAGVSIVFVGEILSKQAMVSIGLVAFGIMSLTLTRGTSGFREPKAIFFALGTGVFIAGYTLVDGLGVRLAGNAHSYTFWLFALDGIPLVVITAFLKRGAAVTEVRKSWKSGLLAGVVSLVAYWIVIWAMSQAPMAMVSAVRETSIVFAVLFGVFFLKERLNLARLASIAITLFGAVLLKASK